MKRKVLPCFMALSMTLTAVPNVAMAEDGSMNEAGTVVETTTETGTTTGTEPAEEPAGEVGTSEVVDTAEGTPVNNGATEGTVVEATEIQPAMVMATMGVTAKNGVVKVATEDELKNAVAKAQDGVETTIQLTDNITLGATLVIPAGKTIKLDLGNFTLGISASENVIENNGVLTVENGSVMGVNDEEKSLGTAIYNKQNATVTINGKSDGSDLLLIGRTGLENYGTATINGGTIESYNRNGIFTGVGSKTYINGGRVLSETGSSGFGRAISSNGDVTITGGEIHSSGSSSDGSAYMNAISMFDYATLTIQPAAGKSVSVVSETDFAIAPAGNSRVLIYGGNFSCNGERNEFEIFQNGSIQIFGGTFRHKPNQDYLDSNCFVERKNDGTYVVKEYQNAETLTVNNYNELVQALNNPVENPKNINISADIVIPAGDDLKLNQGSTIDISDGAVLTVEGILRLDGKMTNEGVLNVTESGFVEYLLHITNYGEIAGYPEVVNGVCEISTPMELQWLSCMAEWNNNNIPEKIVLTADIDLPQDVIFTQIGVEERPYHDSVFDGQNHKISNLQIEAMVDGSLFGTAQDVTIKNLTIDHATVTSTDAYIGALVGLIKENATIDNVHIVDSTVKSPVSYGVGGFAGQIWTKNANARAEFINCSTTNTEVEGYANVGGIWGTSTGSVGTIGIYNSTVSGKINTIKICGGICGGYGNTATVQVIGLKKDDVTIYGVTSNDLVAKKDATVNETYAGKENHAVKDKNGNWVPKTDESGTTQEIVAKIGSVEYVSLEKAMEDAAARGEEIYLEKEITVSKDEVREFAEGVKFDPSGKKVILEVGGTVKAKEDIRNVIQVPAGYRLAVSGNETYGFTYTAEKKSSSSHSYDGYITIINPKNGTVSVSDDWADEDQKITLTITPDKGYVVDKIEIVDLEGDKITAKKVEDKDNKYTFRMANCDVTVTVTFKEEGKTEDKEETTTEETETEETTKPETITFSDVKESDWFYKGVSYVVENGMMNGVGNDQFAPNAPLTREMLAVVLYNMEKQPESTGVNPFADVKANMWYTDAIVWANANGIVAGYDDSTFGLGDSITREQLATILYRYAQLKDYDVTEKADLTGYADSTAISGYAVEAMQWANANGIVNGMTETTLAPQGTATRAQVATMLMNFCENVATKAE